MTPAQAQYKMRQPRRCKIVGASGEKLDWESWYYVEGGGLDIMVRKPGGRRHRRREDHHEAARAGAGADSSCW